MTGAAVNKTKQAVEPESSKASEEIDELKRLPPPKSTVGVIAERSALVNAEQATSQPTPLNDEQVMQDHDGQVSPVDVKKVTPVESEHLLAIPGASVHHGNTAHALPRVAMSANQLVELFKWATELHETITQFRNEVTRQRTVEMMHQANRIDALLMKLLQHQNIVTKNNPEDVTQNEQNMESEEIPPTIPPLIPLADQRVRIVAIGNPGVGKSTFLNCLANQPAFRLGLSYGTGLTKSAAVVAIQDLLLVDTPGLCDMEVDKSAAKQICRVLRCGGRFKLLFFVRLESGRLVIDDLVTLSRVMDTLQGDFQCKFTVVINNIVPSMYEKLKTRGEEYELMMRSLNSTKYVTPHVILNPLNAELDERECAVAELPDDVYTAVVEAPILELTASQVANINTSNYGAERESLCEIIEAKRQRIDRTRATNHQLRQQDRGTAADATRAISQFGMSATNAARASQDLQHTRQAERSTAANAAGIYATHRPLGPSTTKPTRVYQDLRQRSADSEHLFQRSVHTYQQHNQTSAAARSFQSNYTHPKDGQTSGSYSMQEVACQPAQKMETMESKEIPAMFPPLIPLADQRVRIVAIGNPGVGKSTLLNCLANQPAFRSGLSYGTGLTKTAAMVAIQNFLLVDTPGLCDMTIEKNAAMEITRVLRSGGLFKLLFFVRLESGRLVIDDLVTLSRVMDSLRGDFQCKFTVVINNIVPSMYEKLKTRGEEYELMMRSLNSTKYVTPHVILNPLNAELDERECAVAELPDDVYTAVVEAPILELTMSQVSDIDTSDHRAEAEKLRILIEAQRQQIDRTRAANHQLRQQERNLAADAARARPHFASSTAKPSASSEQDSNNDIRSSSTKHHQDTCVPDPSLQDTIERMCKLFQTTNELLEREVAAGHSFYHAQNKDISQLRRDQHQQDCVMM
ncbi:hypothetical protein PINS_up006004 [Pythium insidiosum]|nr:hypothetical protein PINS_up006004 [Pythium insidiosum]